MSTEQEITDMMASLTARLLALNNIDSPTINDALSRFVRDRDSELNQEIQESLWNSDSPVTEHIAAECDRFFRARDLLPDGVMKQMSEFLMERVYIDCLHERLPDLVMYLQSYLQSLLTSNLSTTVKPLVLLACQKHEWFLEREAAVLRVRVPYQKGDRYKGRKASVPQENKLAFVYNTQEIAPYLDTEDRVREHSGCPEAIVSFDGQKFVGVDCDHNRVSIIRKPIKVKRLLEVGVGMVGDDELPVKGLQQFWQHGFVDFLSSFKQSFENIVSPSVYQQLCVYADRFLADRCTAKEYIDELRSVKDFATIFEHLRFVTCASSVKEYNQKRALKFLSF